APVLAADRAVVAADVDQPGPADPLDPARLPGDLLLLPQGLLPVLLRRPARLRGRRADRPQALQPRGGLPVHPPEPPPLLPVPRVHPAGLPVDRRGPVDLPAERRHPDRAGRVRTGLQRRLAERLFVLVPLA